MVSHMGNDENRYNEIKELMERQEKDSNGKLPNAKLKVQGNVSKANIYRFPLGMLHFNKSNGRVKSEVLAKEAQFGRILDTGDEGDQGVLKELILAIRRDENDKVKRDLKQNGQMLPGIITHDGIVINGNRRKALLEELHHETHDPKYGYLEAQVLPSSISRPELWLIEAGIQLSAPQQLDYSPINNLLKLREGLNSSISVADMAACIYGMSEEKLKEDIDRLDIIDEYLNDYLNKSGRYYLLDKKNEHFINLQNILKWLERPRGGVNKDWEPDQNDIAELKIVAFNYIRAQFPHVRIRELRDIFSIKSSWDELKLALEIDTETDETLDDELVPTGGAENEEEEFPDDEDSEPTLIITDAEEKDFRDESRWRNRNEGELKGFFESAKEQLKIQEDSITPLKLARRALRNLSGIRENISIAEQPELDEILGDIIRKVNKLRNFKARKK